MRRSNLKSCSMQSPVTHHRPLISVVFAMLLVMLALPAQTSLFSEYSSARLDNVSALTFDEFGHSDSTINEHRAPVTSLSPDLASLLRSGSWLPEKLGNSEPEYELVIEFTDKHCHKRYARTAALFSYWKDWTRSPPNTTHRIGGWKDSNLLYRYISQAQA